MPVNITDVDAFTSPVVVPADSDPADRTYVVTAAQALADRTRYLHNAIDRPGGRTIQIPAWDMDPRSLGDGTSTGWEEGIAHQAASLENSVEATYRLRAGIELPYGCVVTGIQARVDPGAVRTGTNRMAISAVKLAGSSESAAMAAQYDDGTSAAQTIGATGLSIQLGDGVSDKTLEITVKAGNTGASAQDQILYLTITTSFTKL